MMVLLGNVNTGMIEFPVFAMLECVHGFDLQVIMPKPVVHTNYYDVYVISGMNIFVVVVNRNNPIPPSSGECSCAPAVSMC
jgi:hypothetical protein